MLQPPPLSLLLVDDEPLFRQGLRTLLELFSSRELGQIQVVGEAVSPNQALKLAFEQHPALTLLDMELAADDGVDVLLGLKKGAYNGKVLVLSAHHEDERVYRAMQAGANGYVFKHRLASQLCEAISTVMGGEIYLSPEVMTGFFRMFNFYAGHSLQVCQETNLTEREREVLHWLVQGESNEAIAKHLYVTVATVKAHLTAIFSKLEVKSRTQAIVKALKLGLVAE
ncbi:MAG: response regulator [Synechococcus sp.]